MSQRLDAVAVRRYTSNGEERSAYTNIGVAWPMKDRDGFTLRLHCLPAPAEGEYTILLMPPKARDDERPAPARQQSYAAAKGRPARAGDLDGPDPDNIPF